jgi:hypothetical protein
MTRGIARAGTTHDAENRLLTAGPVFQPDRPRRSVALHAHTAVSPGGTRLCCVRGGEASGLGPRGAVVGLRALRENAASLISLQEYHASLQKAHSKRGA